MSPTSSGASTPGEQPAREAAPQPPGERAAIGGCEHAAHELGGQPREPVGGRHLGLLDREVDRGRERELDRAARLAVDVDQRERVPVGEADLARPEALPARQVLELRHVGRRDALHARARHETASHPAARLQPCDLGGDIDDGAEVNGVDDAA